MLVRYLLDDLVGQQRGVVRSKRGVRGECDALLIAEVDNFLLGTRARRVKVSRGGI